MNIIRAARLTLAALGLLLLAAAVAVGLAARRARGASRAGQWALAAILGLLAVLLLAAAFGPSPPELLGASGSSTTPAAALPSSSTTPAARAVVTGWVVQLPPDPEPYTAAGAAELLARVVPVGGLVEIDITDGIVNVIQDLKNELDARGRRYVTTRTDAALAGAGI